MKSKFNNVKTRGYDSKKEADYAAYLSMMMKCDDESKRITLIEKQVGYVLIPVQRVDGKLVERMTQYFADFRVTYADGRVEVIDVKSEHTKKLPEYVIKRKLMLFVHGIKIKEV